MLSNTSPVFRLLNKKIEDITRSPEEQRLFDSRMKMRSDILTEFELHFNEGREEKRFIIVRSLLDIGGSLDKISKATGLSVDEISSL